MIVSTSEPVTLIDCTLVGAGDLIKTGGGVDLTVRNCRGYGLTPTVDNRTRGRFLDAYQAKQLIIEHNYMEHTAGMVVNRWSGNGSAQQTLTVRYNQGLNCDGRYRNGGKETRSFVQLNTVQQLAGIEISYNEFRNEPNESAVEDNINFYNSSGTAQSPVKVHDNYVQGAYPYPATEPSFHGTGLTTDGDGSTPTTTAAYIEAYQNQFVSTCNAAMNIAAGHHIHFYNNRMVTDGLLPDGTKLKATYAATAVFNYYKKDAATFNNNTISNNTIGYVKWGYNSPYKDRQDLSAGNCATCSETTHLPNPITPAMEQDEWSLWQQKLQQQQVSVGVLRTAGSGGGTILPVALARFESKYVGARLLATWTTAQELNSSYFEVQQSTTGLEFSLAGRVQAAGNSTSARTYSLGLPPLTERVYLRLKMVDTDSSVRYSEVISCQSFAGTTTIRASEHTLYSLTGEQLWRQPASENGPDLRNLRPGIYVLRTRQTDGSQVSEKILIQ
ncbi:T9SS type A sorting domain-containing protein [Hymenobacter sp. BT507]|uniref:T9SS type A sorting domain-containing protein n=1 Tax=Hymenobacter citatus TaxID=2763506 RepID=A0ABR7MP68_9BACT|nr:T9SS type A sorting domain-containing protein [Hymenobacter citatus]MBC6612328.1 T9SS type A sorting domain-containing protein [Hymenobacter citatus]